MFTLRFCFKNESFMSKTMSAMSSIFLVVLSWPHEFLRSWAIAYSNPYTNSRCYCFSTKFRSVTPFSLRNFLWGWQVLMSCEQFVVQDFSLLFVLPYCSWNFGISPPFSPKKNMSTTWTSIASSFIHCILLLYALSDCLDLVFKVVSIQMFSKVWVYLKV